MRDRRMGGAICRPVQRKREHQDGDSKSAGDRRSHDPDSSSRAAIVSVGHPRRDHIRRPGRRKLRRSPVVDLVSGIDVPADGPQTRHQYVLLGRHSSHSVTSAGLAWMHTSLDRPGPSFVNLWGTVGGTMTRCPGPT